MTHTRLLVSITICIFLAGTTIAACTKTDPAAGDKESPAQQALAKKAAAVKKAPTRAERIGRAKEAVMRLKKELKGALGPAMKQGPENALKVCGEQAAALSKKISDQGVLVGRTSNRLRNPKNVMLPWHKTIVENYLKEEKPSPKSYRTVELPDGKLGYAEPLYTKGLCLACHGETIADPIQKLIAKRYPQDKAVGYKDGEFRGIVWAVVP
jgi:hypothetical protein